MAKPILKICPTDRNVFDCPDEELIFGSHLKTLKTYNTYEIEQSEVIDHDLGYQPIYLYCAYEFGGSVIGLVGQNTVDNGAEIDVNDTDVRSYTTLGFSSNALVYIFIEELL